MTVITTVVAGMVIEGLNPIEDLRQFYRGFPYAGTLLAILLAHEMGHYLTARHFGMDVTLPYFIPAPPPLFFLGTLGAFIRMKSPAQHRRALLYVAAAGPIAGFCIALPAIIYAYATSSVAPIRPTDGGIYFGEPLLLQFIGHLIIGSIPQGSALHINSVGVAAWFGLLVTMFNLMPIGQLDGGHIVYAIVGRQARYVSRAVIGGLLLMGFLFFSGWFLWAMIGWATSLRQPVILDQQSPLSRRSRAIAGIALVIFVLCFMPVPISIGNFTG
jgi:membrane-associated protease RseP (regulator of RpoE activity)